MLCMLFSEGIAAIMSKSRFFYACKIKMEYPKSLKYVFFIVAGVAILAGLYLSSLYSYLLFHTMAELFSIAVAFAVFLIAWNCREFVEDNYTSFIGISFLFVGSLDLLHTLAYEGMGVFIGSGSNLATQLWISSRYLHSISFLMAPFFIKRKLRHSWVIGSYLAVAFIVLLSIFYWKIFPTCFIDGVGLTGFKKVSEYVICALFVFSILLLVLKRRHFKKSVFVFVVLSLFLSIASELSFTLYANPYGLANLVGHYLKFIAFYLIYRALVKSQLIDPYSTLFRELKQNEMVLNKTLNAAKARTSEVTSLLDATRSALNSETFEETAEAMLKSCCTLIGAEDGQVILFSDDEYKNKQIITSISDKLKAEGDHTILNKLWDETIKNGYACYNNDINDVFSEISVRNAATAPLVAGNKACGLVTLINKRETFVQNDSRLLTAFAELVSVSLQNFRAIETVRNERKRLENTLNSMHDGVYIVNQNYDIEYANPAMQKLFGLPESKKCYEYLCDSDKPCSWCKFADVLNGDVVRWEYKAKNGRIYDALDAPLVNPDTGAISKLKIIRDMTDIKHAQEEVRNLAKFPSENPYPVLRISEQGKIVYANNSSVDLLKYWDRKLGENIPEDWQIVITESLKTHQRLLKEVNLRDSVVSFAISPVPDGKYVNIYGREITEYRRVEQELKKINEQLELRVKERTKQLQNTVNSLEKEVSERLQAEKELIDNQDKLRDLSTELIAVEERERRKIATQLHDSIGQLLAFSKKELGAVVKTAPENIRKQLERIWDLVRQSVEQTRNLTFDLSSATLYTVGLEAAIEELAEHFSEKEGLNCRFGGCDQCKKIDQQTQVFLYRAVRELLVNIVKHAQAQNVEISTERINNSICIFVSDDGVGFNVSELDGRKGRRGGFGLFSLRERLANIGGNLKIESEIDNGTKVTLTAPSKQNKKQEG